MFQRGAPPTLIFVAFNFVHLRVAPYCFAWQQLLHGARGLWCAARHQVGVAALTKWASLRIKQEHQRDATAEMVCCLFRSRWAAVDRLYCGVPQ